MSDQRQRCEAEECPFWTGDGCACEVLHIEEPDRDNMRRWISS